MRKMKPDEIEEFLQNFGWATLCMADEQGKPYAIEYSYYLQDGAICGLVHSTGRAATILATNNQVCLKVCDADAHCESYTAISCFGTARYEKLTDIVEIATAWDAMEKQLGAGGQYDVHKQKYLNGKKNLPVLKITVQEKTGVTNRPENEEK